MKNLIKLYRSKSDITQAELAEKVNVSRQTIIATESGRYVPSTTLALKIAKILNCRPDEIFLLEDSDW